MEDYKIFANIPYNITAQILRKILYEPSNIAEGYLILQKEAAKKFSGSPRETLFSILAKPFFEFQILFELRRTDFWPVPKVDSVFLSIKRRTRPLIEKQNVASYRDFVQYGFGRWKPNLRLAFQERLYLQAMETAEPRPRFSIECHAHGIKLRTMAGFVSRFYAQTASVHS